MMRIGVHLLFILSARASLAMPPSCCPSVSRSPERITTRVGPTSAALESYHADLGDDAMRPDGARSTPAQEPAFRVTFRDSQGEVHASTVLSTYRLPLGSVKAEARKQRLWDATEQWYRLMGCELLTLELITAYPLTL
jgi:hypothetical protein